MSSSDLRRLSVILVLKSVCPHIGQNSQHIFRYWSNRAAKQHSQLNTFEKNSMPPKKEGKCYSSWNNGGSWDDWDSYDGYYAYNNSRYNKAKDGTAGHTQQHG